MRFKFKREKINNSGLFRGRQSAPPKWRQDKTGRYNEQQIVFEQTELEDHQGCVGHLFGGFLDHRRRFTPYHRRRGLALHAVHPARHHQRHREAVERGGDCHADGGRLHDLHDGPAADAAANRLPHRGTERPDCRVCRHLRQSGRELQSRTHSGVQLPGWRGRARIPPRRPADGGDRGPMGAGGRQEQERILDSPPPRRIQPCCENRHLLLPAGGFRPQRLCRRRYRPAHRLDAAEGGGAAALHERGDHPHFQQRQHRRHQGIGLQPDRPSEKEFRARRIV